MSLVVRVSLTYAVPARGSPSSIIVKLAPPGEVRFELGASMQLFVREMHFYRDLASSTPVAVPRCFHADGDAQTGNAVMVFEDAIGYRPADEILGVTSAQADRIIDMIAAMHARWWRRPELQAFEWLPDAPWGRGSTFADSWPGFVDEYRHWLSAEDRRLGDFLAAHHDDLQAAIDRRPATLVHGDLRADNLLVNDAAAARPVLILDWQVISRGMAAIDPVRLLTGSLERPLREMDFRGYAERWRAGLVAGGVTDHASDDTWTDFRLAMLYVLHVPVCFHSNISHEGAAGIRLMEVLVHRMFRAISECNAVAALGEA